MSRGSDPLSPYAMEPCSHGFIRFYPHDAVNMCLPEEGCEFW